MKIQTSFIALLGLAGVAMAEGSPYLQTIEWTGFLTVQDAPLPISVDKNALRDSVFHIEFFGGEGGNRDVEIVVIDTVDKTQILCDDGGCPSSRDLQLQNCINQNIPLCPVFDRSKTATSFAIDNSQTMATALHVFHTWLRTAVEFNPGHSYFELTPPFWLTDDRGEEFYNSVTSENKVRVSFVDNNPEIIGGRFPGDRDDGYLGMEWWRRWRLFSASDYMELRFDAPIFPENLRRSKDLRGANQPIYIVGYPSVDKFYQIRNVVPEGNIPQSVSWLFLPA